MGIIIKKKIIYFYKTKNVPIAKRMRKRKFDKIMRRFYFNRCFKGGFSTRLKFEKYGN